MSEHGPYRVLGELGSGGMGAVYRAQDTRSGREVALKVLRELDPELLVRFRREVELVREIEHPHLVRVLDADLSPPRPYAVFELVEGETLEQRVGREGPLAWEEAAQLVAQVAAAAAAAHERGLLHRDIKPANVLLGPQGAKLADFGLVRDQNATTLTATGTILGTPSYLAPEQVGADSARWGEPTDVYGLAGTLFFALTGARPFVGATTLDTLRRVLEEPPPRARDRAPGVPAWLDEVCQRGLAKAPGERFPSAVALRAALLHPPSAPAGGGTATLAGLALCAAALAVAGVVGVWRARGGGSVPSAPAVAEPEPAAEPPAPAAAGLEEPDASGSSGDPAPPEAGVEELPGRWAARAQALLGRGQIEAARAAFAEAEARGADPGASARAIASALAQAGDLEGALLTLEQGLERAADPVQLLLQRSLLLRRADRLEESVADLRRAEALEPARFRVALGLATALHQQGRRREALEQAKRACELGAAQGVPKGHLATAHSQYADLLGVQGRFEEAIAEATRAVELDPTTWRALGARGRALQELGRSAEALLDLDAALELEPGVQVVLDARADALLALGRDRDALADLDRLLERRPEDRALRLARAKLRLRLQDFAGGLEDAERAGASARASLVGGLCLAGLGRNDEALQRFDAALERAPQDAEALLGRAVVLQQLGRLEAALADADRAWELTRSPQVRLARVRILRDLGRMEDADQELDAHLAADPGDTTARLVRAEVRRERGKLEGALEDCRRALAGGLGARGEDRARALVAELEAALGQGAQGAPSR